MYKCKKKYRVHIWVHHHEMWGYHHQIEDLKGFETGTASKHSSHTETVE